MENMPRNKVAAQSENSDIMLRGVGVSPLCQARAVANHPTQNSTPTVKTRSSVA